MTPEFRSAIFSWRYDEVKDGQKENSIPLQLQKLFGYLQISNKKSTDTIGLTTSFGWKQQDLFQQQDAQELFRVLFDALEDAFKSTSLSNIIDDMYAGEMVDYIRCIDIDYESERIDKFLDFSFAIIPFGKQKALTSLNQCIKMYLKPEILDGDNQYYAEPVDKKVDAIKGIKVRKLPYIMAIQLKRFVYDYNGYSVVQKKINDIVKFPMVIDMNKYVTRKRRKLSLSQNEENCVDDETVKEPNRIEFIDVTVDEFEEFLQEQITLLKAKSIKAKSSQESDSNVKINSENNEVGSDDEDDCEMKLPDLVDSKGFKSPDQILEEKKLNEDLKYETTGATKDELKHLVETRGEWIYELYAVLIHSGALTGGHYYAYIKDLDTAKWYNFNDASVTEIREIDVQDAWGKAINTYSSVDKYGAASIYGQGYSNWQNNSLNGSSYTAVNNLHNVKADKVTTSFSGANAYMLMYRKVIVSDYFEVKCVKSSSTTTSSESMVDNLNTVRILEETVTTKISRSFPSDDMMPDYIKKEILQEKMVMETKLREEEERKKEFVMSLYRLPNEASLHRIPVKTSDTFISLIDYLWKEWKLINDVEFADILEQQQKISSTEFLATDEDSANSVIDEDNIVQVVVPYHRIRLRQYVPNHCLKSEIIDIKNTNNGMKRLDQIPILVYRSYIIETLGKDDVFQDYTVVDQTILVSIYMPDTNSFNGYHQLSIPLHSSLLDAKRILFKYFHKKAGFQDAIKHYVADTMKLYRLNKVSVVSNNSLIESYHDNNSVVQFKHLEKYYIEPNFNCDEQVDMPSDLTEISNSEESIESKSNEVTPIVTLLPTITSIPLNNENLPGYKLLCDMAYYYNINFNIPLPKHANYSNNECIHSLRIDIRWTIEKLKEVLAEKVNSSYYVGLSALSTQLQKASGSAQFLI